MSRRHLRSTIDRSRLADEPSVGRIGLATLLALALSGAAFGCTGSAREEERDVTACERLRDHVVELRVAEIHQDRDAHRAALRRSLGRGFVATCVEQSESRYDCEMKATSIDALRACAAAE